MSRITSFVGGVVATLLVIAATYAFAMEAMLPPRLKCAVRSADGCMAWTDTIRVERYKRGEAGK